MLKEMFIELVVFAMLTGLEYLVAHRLVHFAARGPKKQKKQSLRKPERPVACTGLMRMFSDGHKRTRQRPNILLIFPSASWLWAMSGIVAAVSAVLFGHFHGYGVIQFVMDSGDSYDWGVIIALTAMCMVWLAVCIATKHAVSWMLVKDALRIAAELEKAGNSIVARQEYSVTEVLALLPWAIKQERKERLAANGRETGVFAVMAFFEDAVDGFVHLASVDATN